MPAYQVVIPKSVEKFLWSVPLPWVGRVVEGLDTLAEHPKLGEESQTPLGTFRRVRLWPYSLLYRCDDRKKHLIVVCL